MPRTREHGRAAWQKARAAQLASEPLCRKCGKRGLIVPATVADHIEPHRGDPEKFWTGALQSLCGHCHDSVKQAEERGGYSPETDEDGLVSDSLFGPKKKN